MKNVGHIAGEERADLRRSRRSSTRRSASGSPSATAATASSAARGFFPSIDELLVGRAGAVRVLHDDPRRRGLPVRGRLRGVSLAIVWGAMAERDEAVGLLRLRRRLHADLLARLALDLAPGRLAVRDGHAGLRRLDGRPLPGRARRRSPGALLLGPRIGKFGRDGRANAIPGHNMPYAMLGEIILWFGWFGFNPGSTLGVVTGGVGFFGYVALTTNLAAAAGALGGVVTAWLVIKKPDLSMMLNGVDRRARRDHRGVRVRRALGGDRDRPRLRRHRRRSACSASSGSASTTRSARSRCTACPASGARCRYGFFAVPGARRRTSRPGTGGLFYSGALPPARRPGARACSPSARSPSPRRSACLWIDEAHDRGIRVEEDVETAGLDVSEHGMWGYPEFYIPVPGGYGTEAHGHLGLRTGTLARRRPQRSSPSPRRSLPADPTVEGAALRRPCVSAAGCAGERRHRRHPAPTGRPAARRRARAGDGRATRAGAAGCRRTHSPACTASA